MSFEKVTNNNNIIITRSSCQSCGQDYNPDKAKARFTSSNS